MIITRDDFDTPEAVNVLSDLVLVINRDIETEEDFVSLLLFLFFKVLGLAVREEGGVVGGKEGERER